MNSEDESSRGTREEAVERVADEFPEEPNDDDEDHDFKVIHMKDEVHGEDGVAETQKTQQEEQKREEDQDHSNGGLWIGIDLGTSNCACAVWDSERGSPKWMRLAYITEKQSNGKVGRIVPSVVQIERGFSNNATDNDDPISSPPFTTAVQTLWEDIHKWNNLVKKSSSRENDLALAVGQKAIEKLQRHLLLEHQNQVKEDAEVSPVIKNMKRVLGICYTTKLKDIDPALEKSLPFELELGPEGEWVVPIKLGLGDEGSTIYLRPVHVSAILLQAIRQSAQAYLRREIPKKRMIVPGYNPHHDHNHNNTHNNCTIKNVVVGAPAHFGQRQRQAIEEAARLAGFGGHVSTLTESTAAAMSYGLFVGQGGDASGAAARTKSILVLDMGGGTTDITIAHMNGDANNNSEDSYAPDQRFRVILTDGDSRLGGEDMDQALLDLVLSKAAVATRNDMAPQQRQQLLRSCQQAKELLCGDIDHDDPPAESAAVSLPSSFQSSSSSGGAESIELSKIDLEQAIQPLLDRTAMLMERTLKRYSDKLSQNPSTLSLTSSKSLVHEAILIGGATRVPALRQMLKHKFFGDIELCTSVNAMSAVAQGTAIQAAILSGRVPLHEVRSAMMLDTTPHSIGVLLQVGGSENNNNERFVEILPRDSPLPAESYATFFVADLDQKGVTVKAVERIEGQQHAHQSKDDGTNYQPLGEFTFLLHRLTGSQRDAILHDQEKPGLRPVDIGMSLESDGAFQVTIFDRNDPDHRRKKEFYKKSKQDAGFEAGLLDYVQAAADLKDDSMTAEEAKLIVVVAALFVFYIVVKVLLSKDVMVSDEEMARIL